MIICALSKWWQDCPSDEHKHAEAALGEAKPLAGLNHSLDRQGGIISRTL